MLAEAEVEVRRPWRWRWRGMWESGRGLSWGLGKQDFINQEKWPRELQLWSDIVGQCHCCYLIRQSSATAATTEDRKVCQLRMGQRDGEEERKGLETDSPDDHGGKKNLIFFLAKMRREAAEEQSCVLGLQRKWRERMEKEHEDRRTKRSTFCPTRRREIIGYSGTPDTQVREEKEAEKCFFFFPFYFSFYALSSRFAID